MSHTLEPGSEDKDGADREDVYEVEDTESAGTADPTAKFREDQPSPDEIEQIEEERAERLDPANRPPNAEVDNTQRTFDPAKGDFID
jgi:hypothetical protein